jgi:drug/metabolite transporter (DMT)-like permease
MFFVFLLYALFASVFTVSKTGLEYTAPFFFVGSRMVLAGILLLGYQFLFHRSTFQIKREHTGLFFRLALFNIYLTNMFEFWGLQYLTSFKTCFIYSLSPFASALFSVFVFSEKISVRKWIGLLIGFAGIIPVLLSQTTAEERGGQLFLFSWAELAVMGAAICSVYGWILLKQLVQDNGYSPLMANGVSMLLGGTCALLHSFLTESWHPVPVSEYIPFLACACVLIVISNLVSYNLYGWLLKRFSPTFMSFAGLSTPLFSAFFGWFFLGEIITWPFYVSLCIVSLGLILFYQEELKATETVSSA